MTLTEVVMKLVGPVKPVGETHTDHARYENLKALTELASDLLVEIAGVARNRNSHEYSRKHAAEYADEFLASVAAENKPEGV